MADHDRIAHIRAYLEQHGDTYDRDALRQRLLADGHDPEAVDLAMAQVYGLQVTPQPAPGIDQGSSYNTTLFVVVMIGTVVLNIILFCSAGSITARGFLEDQALTLAVGLGLLSPLVIEGVASLLMRRRNAAVSRGLMWGAIATAVVLMLAVLLIGVCIVIFVRPFA